MGPWRIPDGYEELVRVHLRANGGNEELGIGAGDFPDQSILIRFADGSFAHFSVCIHDSESNPKRSGGVY